MGRLPRQGVLPHVTLLHQLAARTPDRALSDSPMRVTVSSVRHSHRLDTSNTRPLLMNADE